jgi:hypothetical protein
VLSFWRCTCCAREAREVLLTGEDVSADVVDEGAMDAEEGGAVTAGRAKAVKAILIRATRQSPRILWPAILSA